jgi:putative sterol carrier protein
VEVDLLGVSGLTATIQFEITGAPEGEESCHWEITDGRLVSTTRGKIRKPDVTLTMDRPVAASIQQGTLDPNVAFMRGRLKVVGAMEVMMALLPISKNPEFGQLLAQIATETGP